MKTKNTNKNNLHNIPLDGKTLRRITEAGIPIISLLSNWFSKTSDDYHSTGEIGELIKGGYITMDLVREVLKESEYMGIYKIIKAMKL